MNAERTTAPASTTPSIPQTIDSLTVSFYGIVPWEMTSRIFSTLVDTFNIAPENIKFFETNVRLGTTVTAVKCPDRDCLEHLTNFLFAAGLIKECWAPFMYRTPEYEKLLDYLSSFEHPALED